jgi:CTP:phosphocholine cytidylyltransferase-like protein
LKSKCYSCTYLIIITSELIFIVFFCKFFSSHFLRGKIGPMLLRSYIKICFKDYFTQKVVLHDLTHIHVQIEKYSHSQIYATITKISCRQSIYKLIKNNVATRTIFLPRSYFKRVILTFWQVFQFVL